ncbi:Fc receptor-like protein 5 isoform X2 [Rhinatrema bivittatum]|nr:Fc receptor-like protein 5 isoform X2 [Rhinatrema bivittatum]
MLPSGAALVIVCLSGRLLLAVKAPPAPPSVSLAAGYTVYMTGEPAVLRCEVAGAQGARGYQFYKEGREVTEGHRTPSPGTYSIASVNKGAAGSYSCAYWTLEAGASVLSRESPPVSLYVIDHLPTPRLSFEPPSPVYISGEPVTLRCAHPEADGVVGYRFYRDDAEAPVGGGSPSEPTYRMAGAREEEAGWYSCLYQSEVRGRVIRSMRSARHLLAITAQPPAPSLTLQPAYPVYITGEPVTMGCASPGPAAVTGYRFYKDGREVTERPGASPRDYVISGVSGQTAGTYRCIYWTGERGRDIPAVPSTPVAVVVIDPLRPPAFSLTPSDGRVGDGENLTLACSAPAGSGNVQMLFLRDGEVVHRGQSPNRTERNFRFSFRAMRGNASHVGNYSCYYEADVRGRLLISPQSSPRQVTVEAPKLLWLVIIGLGAGLGSLLLAVLLILLCRARLARTGAKTDQSSPVPHEDGEIAYTALTVSTLTSTRSAP